MILFAFDVDHTLAVVGGKHFQYPPGPIPVATLGMLRDEGHIVGVCGNWPVFLDRVPNWFEYVSFIGPMRGLKDTMLKQLKVAPADRYIMVGNDPFNPKWREGVSEDSIFAANAEYEFIEEDAFMDLLPTFLSE